MTRWRTSRAIRVMGTQNKNFEHQSAVLFCFLLPWTHSMHYPLLTSVLVLYTLKTLENQGFSGVFRGHKLETLATNKLMCTLRTETIFGNWSWKWWKMLFISPQKLFSFSRYLNFYFDFGHVAKWFDLKDQVNFKIYDVTAWETNTCNTHITQYLEK